MSFGRLERAQVDPPMSEINVTPLVDVMLVLLVIFIIAAPLMASAIRIDLPKNKAGKAGLGATHAAVVVNREGTIFLNEKAVSLPELKQQLRTAAGNNPDTEVQLRADEAVPYGKIVEVMGLAHEAGLNRIGFVTQPPSAAKP